MSNKNENFTTDVVALRTAREHFMFHMQHGNVALAIADLEQATAIRKADPAAWDAHVSEYISELRSLPGYNPTDTATAGDNA